MSQLQMDFNRQVDEYIEKINYGGCILTLNQNHDPPLVPLFQELRRRSQSDDELANRLREITWIAFVQYDFTEFPPDIDIRSVFPDFTECSFHDCSKLSSLKNITDIVTLEKLGCAKCPSIISLSSLASLPRASHLKELIINSCNLNPTHEDDWDDAFQAIGNATGSNDFTLSIISDDTMTFLPSSIRHLKEKLGNVRFELRMNSNLQRLPYEIGQLQNMVWLQIIRFPASTSLPWTIGRLPP
eukprot:CAMPEP_0197239850 /NCGR_PEP_ID=MMETSP1429-20130617/6258_1 /TAXON_ID=49237 /ORGANISM="Chaetoceros  sp., Strain UNC1202" /LENGTH=242 /DNA_ID=CAMNT_0042699359 /DNA_START=51 /DNA_END=776 /DNA_ORIENTATION=+